MRNEVVGFYILFEVKGYKLEEFERFPITIKKNGLEFLIDVFDYSEDKLILDIFVSKTKVFEIVHISDLMDELSTIFSTTNSNIRLISMEIDGFKVKF